MKTTMPQGERTGQSARKKIHELSAEELSLYQVSDKSQFKDWVWFVNNLNPGVKGGKSKINWAMTLFDGSILTDAQHAQRLQWAKILVLTLLVLPARRHRTGAGSLPQLQRQLKWLLSWMSNNGYHYPHELTPTVIEQYLDYLPSYLATISLDEEIGVATAAQAVTALINLWNQRDALSKMGVQSLQRHPFGGLGAQTIAKGLATKAQGWIKPLPDEVAIPLLNKAAWFLGTPADDVLKLLDVVRFPRTGTNVRTSQKITGKSGKRVSKAIHFLDSFEFSILEGESNPWHEKIDLAFEQSSDLRAARISRVRELWEAVRDAAAIIVQGTSGMRLSELLGILAGLEDATGLPKNVRLEMSATGLFQWFVIRSQLSKTEEGLPREVDWVLGMRPVGSKEIPLAVRALKILNQLHEPWRACASTDRLILANRQGCSLPSPSVPLDAMSTDMANRAMQRFITRWVDLSSLPDESVRKTEDNDLVRWRECKGDAFRTHMLRKTWAQFALACDSRLLPAIQMQFHHLSLAMTESGYIGRNPLLLAELDSISTQKTNLTIFEIIVGKNKVAGRMGEQLEQTLEKLRAETDELPTSDKWKQVVGWTERKDLKMFFTPHATCCPTRTSEMRCHDESKSPIWLRQAPNPATREPSLCAGCACAIMDKSHEPFWSDRYVGCEVSLRQADLAGAHSGMFREIRFRAGQARSILKKFGADLDALDARVISIVESEHAET
ncbi:phage integrase [Janthinobacterium sp. HH01]|uniref:hypothetical protein n=1 Tax=Janthinobacterium sp. HH01 TaxID=1198452 RepID=UPI0002AE7DF7|nr:hypothetical protein [Janthinobacterium sp. HH01]ELX10182.1 phage integrase [Janthinobacterium sp. HH01]